MATYAACVISRYEPLALWLLDTLPSFGTPVADQVGSRDGTWSIAGSSNPPLPESHPAILGNGDGSSAWPGRYMFVDHDLPEHSSWTATALLADLAGSTSDWYNWAFEEVIGRAFLTQDSPPPLYNTDAIAFPAWLMGTDAVLNGSGDDDPGTAKALWYRTSIRSEQVWRSSPMLSAGSEHWVAWRFKASARELSFWVDGDKVAATTLSYVPAHPAGQRLHVRFQPVSTARVAVSHVAYWTRAVTDDELAEMGQIALAGGCDDGPAETIEVQPVNVVTAITGSVTLQTRVDVDGGAP